MFELLAAARLQSGRLCLPPESFTAFQLLIALGSENISGIQRFNTDISAFESASSNKSGQAMGVDFLIIRGEGYFFYMKQEVLDFSFQ
jgi:hypothetical protein